MSERSKQATGRRHDIDSSSEFSFGDQLRLIPGGSPGRDWDLDERTRKLGLQGVAQARAVLRQARPPEPKQVQDRKAS
jgi:hypothetical protein